MNTFFTKPFSLLHKAIIVLLYTVQTFVKPDLLFWFNKLDFAVMKPVALSPEFLLKTKPTYMSVNHFPVKRIYHYP